MTKRAFLLAAAPLALLAGCSSNDTTTFAITTGAYNVKAGTATPAFPNDNCNIVQYFTVGNPPINVEVSGTTARFDLKGGQTLPQYFTTANITGNAIEHVTDANFQTVVEGTLCTFRTHVQVKGDLVGNDDTHLIAKYDIDKEPGATCTIADVDVKTLPCTSEVDFLATKVVP